MGISSEIQQDYFDRQERTQYKHFFQDYKIII
jgi:hypothetical protein